TPGLRFPPHVIYDVADPSTAMSLCIAERINPFETVTGHIHWRNEPKKSGAGYRIICALPPALRGSHFLIKDVLEAQFCSPQHIYDIKGRGRDCAALAIKRALEAGYEHCFIGDVRDCYQHVSASSLADQLPLPRSVVSSALDYRNLALRHRRANSVSGGIYASLGHGWNGPQGLLQGSPASSIILAMLFARMAAQIDPHDCLLFTVSDNLLIAAKSEPVLATTISLIRDFFHGHPAGPFDLKPDSRVVGKRCPFEFLGYAFEFVSNGVAIEPSHAGWDRLYGRIVTALDRDLLREDRVASESEAAIRDSFSGYSAWTNREGWKQDFLENAWGTVKNHAYGPSLLPETYC
ncbi:hypothetical protein, partial [Sphingobium fuliginis]|uniref:hypothetical protein n=1 Tax=Sphingobium fuliginis (strain ATCC 27551) TaxID=336203 RepID=UPI0037CAC013